MIKGSLHRFFKHNDTQVFKRYVFVGLASNSAIYLIYLVITIRKVWHTSEIVISKVKHSVDLCAIYWHFLLAVWLVLFGLMLFS